MHKINKLQGYIIQHREYNQYFIITRNGIQTLNVVNHYVSHLKHIMLYVNYSSKKKNQFISS